METLEIKTSPAEIVLQHHLEAFLSNDVDEIMKDFSEESEVWTSEGVFKGLNGISSFFSYMFTLLPRESTDFSLKQQIVNDGKAYVTWSAESPFISIPTGTDSFLIEDDKILWQTTAAHIVPKKQEG